MQDLQYTLDEVNNAMVTNKLWESFVAMHVGEGWWLIIWSLMLALLVTYVMFSERTRRDIDATMSPYIFCFTVILYTAITVLFFHGIDMVINAEQAARATLFGRN